MLNIDKLNYWNKNNNEPSYSSANLNNSYKIFDEIL